MAKEKFKRAIYITIVSCFMLLGIASCAGSSSGMSDGLQRIAVKAGTLALFESSGITPDQVIEHIEKLKTAIDQDEQLDTAALAHDVLILAGVQAMQPSTQLLVEELVFYIQRAVDERDLAGQGKRLSLLTMLTWVQESAQLAALQGVGGGA